MKILSDIFVGMCMVALLTAIFWPTDLRRRRSQRALEALDVEAFLAAIRAVESGGDPHAVGPGGELSAYQFTELTWRQHTEVAFTWAQSPKFADKIAKSHLAWLSGRLIQRRVSITPRTLAMAWHRGPAAVHSGDYEERVVNLYESRHAR